MLWGIYNQYVWLITSDITTYELIKSSADEQSGDIHWLLYTTIKDSTGAFIGLWKQPAGMFIGSYTSTYDAENGVRVFDRAAVEELIHTFEGSIQHSYIIAASQPSVYEPEVQSETPTTTKEPDFII